MRESVRACMAEYAEELQREYEMWPAARSCKSHALVQSGDTVLMNPVRPNSLDPTSHI